MTIETRRGFSSKGSQNLFSQSLSYSIVNATKVWDRASDR